MTDLLDPLAPLDHSLGERRAYDSAGETLRVGRERDGRIMLRILGIGRDQDNPENEALAAWIARFERPEELVRTWGTEWQIPSDAGLVRLLRRMAEQGLTLRERHFEAQDAEGFRRLTELLLRGVDLGPSACWTWPHLQVQLTRAHDPSGRLQLRGYDHPARDDQRHPDWERLADELAERFEVDTRWPKGGTRVLVPPSELEGLVPRIVGLQDEPMDSMWLTLSAATRS